MYSFLLSFLGYIQKPFTKFSFLAAKLRTNSEIAKCIEIYFCDKAATHVAEGGVAAYERIE